MSVASAAVERRDAMTATPLLRTHPPRRRRSRRRPTPGAAATATTPGRWRWPAPPCAAGSSCCPARCCTRRASRGTPSCCTPCCSPTPGSGGAASPAHERLAGRPRLRREPGHAVPPGAGGRRPALPAPAGPGQDHALHPARPARRRRRARRSPPRPDSRHPPALSREHRVPRSWGAQTPQIRGIKSPRNGAAEYDSGERDAEEHHPPVVRAPPPTGHEPTLAPTDPPTQDANRRR